MAEFITTYGEQIAVNIQKLYILVESISVNPPPPSPHNAL